MKPSNDTVILRDDNGLPHSIFSKADYTAEHEGRLDELYRLIGAKPGGFEGLPSFSLAHQAIPRALRGIAMFEQTYGWREAGAGKGGKDRQRRSQALCMRLSYDMDGRPQTIWSHWRRSEQTEMSCAWSDSGFEIMAYSDGAKDFLNEVAAAIKEGDFACFKGGRGSNPFDRGGLVICIPSRVPQAYKDQMAEGHADRKRLLEAAAETGIEGRIRERIEGSGSHRGFPHVFSEYRYHALAPAWATTIKHRGDDRGGPVTTDHPVIFFLNPGSKSAEAGWYTVEELDGWLAGKGPVLKVSREAVAARQL